MLLDAPRCQGIRVSDQIWMNYKISRLSQALENAALSMGAEFVDIYDASQGYELCNPQGNEKFMHGINKFTSARADESFHPTALGYSLIADRLATSLEANRATTTYTVHPGETIRIDVPLRDPFEPPPGISFSSSWPGSDVVMTLRSPSGRVIDRNTQAADVVHRVGPTQELYYVTDPEPGTWTVELYGRDVAPSGEPTTLNIYEVPEPNREPTAAMTLSQAGRTVTLDAGASQDSDGEIKTYLWDFGDGTMSSGKEVTHRYGQAGTYRVTLVTIDNRGAMGFATADHDVLIPKYNFQGFYAPINNQPTVNLMQAGRAVPVKFSLGKDEGLDIFEIGYPKVQEVDCSTGVALDEVEDTVTAGSSDLSYDPISDTYTYVWKTQDSWAGTCRRLVVGLNDGSRPAADLMFR